MKSIAKLKQQTAFQTILTFALSSVLLMGVSESQAWAKDNYIIVQGLSKKDLSQKSPQWWGIGDITLTPGSKCTDDPILGTFQFTNSHGKAKTDSILNSVYITNYLWEIHGTYICGNNRESHVQKFLDLSCTSKYENTPSPSTKYYISCTITRKLPPP